MSSLKWTFNKLCKHQSYWATYLLFRRNGLVQAISGRNTKQLVFLLNFVLRYIGVRKLSKTLTHVASTLIGKYIVNFYLIKYSWVTQYYKFCVAILP